MACSSRYSLINSFPSGRICVATCRLILRTLMALLTPLTHAACCECPIYLMLGDGHFGHVKFNFLLDFDFDRSEERRVGKD